MKWDCKIYIIRAMKSKYEKEKKMKNSLPLHVCHVQKSLLIGYRIHSFIHGAALMALIYYRVTNLHFLVNNKELSLIFPHVLVFASELFLSFLWLLDQAYRWRPVSRTVFPERLSAAAAAAGQQGTGDDNDMLPSIDVLICTADPNKEPSEEVMNTVISAMALDYPPQKLHVYLSDDAGCSATLFAMKESWKFARLWIPFCRKYGIIDQTRCPQAYFAENNEDCPNNFSCNIEFKNEKIKLKKQYDLFKEKLKKFNANNYATTITCKNHPPKIEVIKDSDEEDSANLITEMPLLVYVSREKRPSQPHNFKAGALNVLLRVSGILSNSPYILVLDCDMYSNDPTSARQAMCFHLDSKISPNLAFVQFPQKFHNISEHDIYDSKIRQVFQARWKGFDGIGGPVISGTCFYIKRIALYGISSTENDFDLVQLRKTFGLSDEFIKSLQDQTKTNVLSARQEISSSLLQMTEILASCDYEKHSSWGKQVRFRYFSVAEDYFTGFMLKCKGWNSVYLNPTRPAFLGSGTTNLGDCLVQSTRWTAGLVEVAISKYTPLLYGPPRTSILQSMCYAELSYSQFSFLPCWCLATIPQLCLLRDIPLYPPVSNSFSMVFGFIFLSSNLKIIHEVLQSEHSIWAWVYELRIWMMRSITSYLYGSVNVILEKIGAAEASFLPTNKATDEEQSKLYKMGKYNFQISRTFITPICTLVILNSAALIIGIAKIIICSRNHDQMFLQAFLLFFIFVMQYPVVEGMIIRKDEGRVPQSVTVQSAVLAVIILSLAYLLPL